LFKAVYTDTFYREHVVKSTKLLHLHTVLIIRLFLYLRTVPSSLPLVVFPSSFLFDFSVLGDKIKLYISLVVQFSCDQQHALQQDRRRGFVIVRIQYVLQVSMCHTNIKSILQISS
jgi:hypothetical protein